MEPENTSPFFYRCRVKASRNEADVGNESTRSAASVKRACSDESGRDCDRDRHESADFPERGSSAGRADSE